MLEYVKGWLNRQLQRETFWPAVGIVVSIVWLFRSKQGVEEFQSWAFAFGGLAAILTGGVVANKRLNISGPTAPSSGADPALDVSQEIPPK